MSVWQPVKLKNVTLYPCDSIDVTLWTERNARAPFVRARLEVSEAGVVRIIGDDGAFQTWEQAFPEEGAS